MMLARKATRYALLSAGLAAVLAAPAAAQIGDCAPRDMLLGKLQQAFAEEPVHVGVTVKGELLEVLVGPSGTWTVLVSIPGGPTCVASHGDGWRALKPEPEERVSAPFADWTLSRHAALAN
ncbi:MAG: hypothetical protein ACFCUQ_12085 [Kiloniellales bacterium]